jgi:hypothetical protein
MEQIRGFSGLDEFYPETLLKCLSDQRWHVVIDGDVGSNATGGK